MKVAYYERGANQNYVLFLGPVLQPTLIVHVGLDVFHQFFDTANDSQLVIVVASAEVKTQAVMRNDDDKSTEFGLHLASLEWIVGRYKGDRQTYLDARRFRFMFFNRHNKALFDRRGLRRDSKLSE